MKNNDDEIFDFDDDELLEKEEEKTTPLASKKSFIIICAVATVAIIVAGIAATSAISPAPDISESTPSTVSNQARVESKAPTSSVSSSVTSDAPSAVTSSVPVKESATDAPPVASYFIMPVSGAGIYKEFSANTLTYSLTYGDYRAHLALDITSDGEKVTSCGDGIVTDISEDALLGNTVTVDHGNGRSFRYCGLGSDIPVKVGDKVTSTTVLGSLGTVPSECLDKPHLHLEAYKDGALIDPASLIKQ